MRQDALGVKAPSLPRFDMRASSPVLHNKRKAPAIPRTLAPRIGPAKKLLAFGDDKRHLWGSGWHREIGGRDRIAPSRTGFRMQSGGPLKYTHQETSFPEFRKGFYNLLKLRCCV